MIFTGFTDEVSPDMDVQIQACRDLGWSHIDLRTAGDKNICHYSLDELDRLLETLNEHNLKIASFGSPVANWSRTTGYSLPDEILELKHASALMRKAGVSFIRIMSYRQETPVSCHHESGKPVAFRLKELSRVAEDEGIVLLHENCETWGGQSREHTLYLLNMIQSPAFRLIFDTGNPPGSLDVRGNEPYAYQDGFEFLKSVIEYTELIHIKDARVENGKTVYTWPGEGQGRIPEILSFLAERSFNGPVSIEPHLSVVFHDPSVQSSEEECRRSFVEYARRSRELLVKAGFRF